ncbi:MAG: hypothetical protein IKN73_02085 [Alphaproteobacteria bacterium]|nr:hypothetical protein [Alphaproteobacteria bacterium]
MKQIKAQYKVLLLTPFIALVMNACKAYENTVIMVSHNKVLLKDNSTNEERLLDCSKKSAKYPNLISDLPYFKEGDAVKFKPGKKYTYEGFRAYSIQDSELQYNPDSIQIRKDKKLIDAFKAKAATDSIKTYVR